jgi:hypothetical protein
MGKSTIKGNFPVRYVNLAEGNHYSFPGVSPRRPAG